MTVNELLKIKNFAFCIYSKEQFDYIDNHKTIEYLNNDDLKTSIIYFLVINNEIIYVGQTNTRPSKRFKKHASYLDIDYIIFTPLENNIRDNVNYWEQYFIQKCNPPLNYILTAFETNNKSGKYSVDDILKWGKKKTKKPGRPKVKTEETKTINIAIPISLMKDINIAKCKYHDNLTEYINAVVRADLDANMKEYQKINNYLKR